VLKPFYLGTVMMSGKNYPSIGLAHHAVQKITHFCTHDNNNNKDINELEKLLLTKIHQYFYNDYEQFQYFQVNKTLNKSLNKAEKHTCKHLQLSVYCA
jgi:hypothetical protein